MCITKESFLRDVRRSAIAADYINEYALLHSYSDLATENKGIQSNVRALYYYNALLESVGLKKRKAQLMQHTPPLLTILEDNTFNLLSAHSISRKTFNTAFQIAVFEPYTDDSNKQKSSLLNRSKEQVYQSTRQKVSRFFTQLMNEYPRDLQGNVIGSLPKYKANYIAARSSVQMQGEYNERTINNFHGATLTFAMRLCTCQDN